MSKSFFFLNFQMYFESYVSFEYFLWSKDLVWFRYRSLKVVAVMPMSVLYAACVAC